MARSIMLWTITTLPFYMHCDGVIISSEARFGWRYPVILPSLLRERHTQELSYHIPMRRGLKLNKTSTTTVSRYSTVINILGTSTGALSSTAVRTAMLLLGLSSFES